MNSRLFKIILVPTLGVWALLWAIYVDQFRHSQGQIPPPWIIVVYMFVSAILALSLIQELGGNSNSDSVVIATKSYCGICCLGVSSLIALVGVIALQTGNPWLCAAIGSCLILSVVVDGLSGYSNEQTINGYQRRSQERSESLDLRQQYKSHLISLAAQHIQEPSVLAEVSRVQNILPYSSFFRSDAAANTLYELKAEQSPVAIAKILSGIS